MHISEMVKDMEDRVAALERGKEKTIYEVENFIERFLKPGHLPENPEAAIRPLRELLKFINPLGHDQLEELQLESRILSLFRTIEFGKPAKSLGNMCPCCGALDRWEDDVVPERKMLHAPGCDLDKVIQRLMGVDDVVTNDDFKLAYSVLIEIDENRSTGESCIVCGHGADIGFDSHQHGCEFKVVGESLRSMLRAIC